MKLWLKYAAGIIFGAALAFVAPPSLFEGEAALAVAAELALRLGYYIFIALIAVNLPLSVGKLSEHKTLWRHGMKSLGFFLISTLAASILGIASVLLAGPSRLPIDSTAIQGLAAPAQNGAALIYSLVPRNLGTLLEYSGDIGAPLLVLGMVLGLAMGHDAAAARPFADVLDSLSRILYTVNTFLSEILGLLLIPASAKAFHEFSGMLSNGSFQALFLILGLGFLVIVFALMPLVLFFLNGKENPYPYLYAFLPALLASLASGNLRFSAGVLIRGVGENLGLSRRSSSISLVAGLAAGRVGTAFTVSATAVFILSSYSSLAVSPLNVTAIALIVPLACFAAGWALPGGPLGVLALVFSIFGRGFEAGFLAAAPIALALSAFAAGMDLVWIGVCSPFCSGIKDEGSIKPTRHFI